MAFHYSVDEEAIGPVSLDIVLNALSETGGGGLYIYHEDLTDDWTLVQSEADINNLGVVSTESEATSELPEPWEAHIDEDSGSTYYYNPETGMTSWDPPEVSAKTDEHYNYDDDPAAPASSFNLNPGSSPPDIQASNDDQQDESLQDMLKHPKRNDISDSPTHNVTENANGGKTIEKTNFLGPWSDVYVSRTLPDGDEWLDILRKCRESSTVYEDPDFKAEDASIWRDPLHKQASPYAEQLKEAVEWRRISEIFDFSIHIKFTFNMLPVSKELTPKICGMGLETDEDVASLCKKHGDGLEESPDHHPASAYLEVAKTASKAGLSLDNEALVACCSEGVVSWLNKKADENMATVGEMLRGPGKTNFDIFWGSMTEIAAPAEFSSFGEALVWKEKSETEGIVPFIRLLLPVHFAPRHIQLFERESPSRPLVAPGDVRQGILGDCYFLGALSVVASHQDLLFSIFPDLSSDLVVASEVIDDARPNEQQVNKEGLYAVRFWREGRWHIVVVDDRVPVNSSGRPCFAQLPEHGCEIWALIAEKAFAKLNGSYEAIIAGHENEALQDITGGLPLTFKLHSNKNGHQEAITVDGLWKELNDFSRTDEISLVCASTSEAKSGIMAGHAYGIIDIQEVAMKPANPNNNNNNTNDKTTVEKMIRIRNPWGKGQEWSGSFSDSDLESWERVSAETRSKIGMTVEDDGTWWMTFQDFFLNFDVVNVCRLLHQPNWIGHQAVGEWFGDEAPGGQTSHENAQYQLILHEDSTVFVNVGQPSARARGGTYTFASGPLVEFCQNNISSIGKRSFEVGLTKNRAGAKLELDRECCIELQLKASEQPYLIIPITQNLGDSSKFFVSVFTSGRSEFLAIEDGGSGYKYETKLSLIIPAEHSGGCYPNFSSWWTNPQYILRIGDPDSNSTDEGTKKQNVVIVLDNMAAMQSEGGGTGKSLIDNMVPLGFAIFKVHDEHVVTSVKSSNHVGTSDIAPRPTICKIFQLDPGLYMVLPFTFEKDTRLEFCLTVASDEKISPLGNVRPWYSHIVFVGEWIKNMSGGW